MSNISEKLAEHNTKMEELKATKARLQHELQIKYDYKDDLLGKLTSADQELYKKQEEYHLHQLKIRRALLTMRAVFEEEFYKSDLLTNLEP